MTFKKSADYLELPQSKGYLAVKGTQDLKSLAAWCKFAHYIDNNSASHDVIECYDVFSVTALLILYNDTSLILWGKNYSTSDKHSGFFSVYFLCFNLHGHEVLTQTISKGNKRIFYCCQ